MNNQYKEALVKILCIQPLQSATDADLWLAIGEMRKICADALTEKRWPTTEELNAEAASLESVRGKGKEDSQ